MKRVIITIILFTAFSLAKAGNIRFNGYVREGDTYLFSLNSENGADGRWYSLGEQIGGLVIKYFDQDAGKLILNGASGEIAISLVESRVGAARRWDISKREELARIITAMGPSLEKPLNPLELPSPEDYIAVGTSYGLVTRRRIVDNTEIVEMIAPDIEARKTQSPPVGTTTIKIKIPNYKNRIARRIEIEVKL